MARAKILLFDIDGTLLDTGGAGLGALLDAAEECFEVSREQLPPLDLAGATDGGVVRKIFSDIGVRLTDAAVKAYHSSYLGHLHRRMTASDFAGVLLPGVEELLESLSGEADFHLGLLTGNMRRGAAIKLERFDILHHFHDGAFGDDAEDRNHLGPIALQRMKSAVGVNDLTAQDVIVIGDTPRDIDCARALGARCLAVSTGRFSAAELEQLQPWRVLEDLSDTTQVIRQLASA